MDTAAVGAFLSGVGAVIGGVVSLRLVQKRMHHDCDQRVEELMRTLREGIEIGEHHE